MAALEAEFQSCGHAAYIEKYLTFPPPGNQPVEYNDTCDVFGHYVDAAIAVNPCWDIYQVATTCPNLWDVLGFPGSFYYTPVGADIYFDRADVKAAINAPQTEW